MHKIFLTEPEVSFIQGADSIVAELGGFPSMENGKLLGISVQDCGLENRRYNVSLVFDIEKWATDSARYMDIPKPKHRYIQMWFSHIRNVFINSPSIYCCGEFKFGNTTDRRNMYQDVLPSKPAIIERPFCCFYMRRGRDFILEFEEDTCTVCASFFDDDREEGSTPR